MIGSLLGILSAGLLFEVPSGIAPGPVLVLIISETLGYGICAGTKVACIPLLTDAPVVLASAFLFTPNLKNGYPAGCNFTGWISFSALFGYKKYPNRQRRNTVLYHPEATLLFEVVLVFSGLLFGLLILMS